MKEWICAAAGTVGGLIAGLFGGWDAAMLSLLIFMGIDYITGVDCGGIWKVVKERQWRTVQQNRLAWSCKKVYHLAAGIGCRTAGHRAWYGLCACWGLHWVYVQ